MLWLSTARPHFLGSSTNPAPKAACPIGPDVAAAYNPTMQFSGAVRIGDLNDFIAPSQACVVNLNGGKLDGGGIDDPQVGMVALQPRVSRAVGAGAGAAGFSQTLPAAADGAVKVSLHDCLACSGCVTSAETVLLEHQSGGELLARLADAAVATVVTLSPQSVTALAAAHGLTPADAAGRLAGFFRSLGAAAVFDAGWARDVALTEVAAEFVRRVQQARPGAAAADLAAAASVPSSGDSSMTEAGGAAPAAPTALPMLASACPGWVCYAEKTHGTFVLPHISTAKSPQAVMGTLVKRQWAPASGREPGQVYHCAVMPCYDKKLEASREDFWTPGGEVPETDCVLATTEVVDLLAQHGADLGSLPPASLDPPFTNVATPPGSGSGGGGGGDGTAAAGPLWYYGARGGSGGYLEHTFRAAAAALLGRAVPPGAVELVQGRNADLREAVLDPGDGRRPLRFAAVYGFRNIQGLMRKMKLGKCEYDYVEVMACPSGCLNGGGQPKPAAGQSAQQLVAALEAAYHGEGMALRPPEDNAAVAALYQGWVGGPPGSDAARALLHTGYHRREKTAAASIGDW